MFIFEKKKSLQEKDHSLNLVLANQFTANTSPGAIEIIKLYNCMSCIHETQSISIKGILWAFYSYLYLGPHCKPLVVSG